MDKNKVVTLQQADKAPAPNALTVERAEELVEAAKEGTLQGFVVIGETANGELFEGGTELLDPPLIFTGLELAKFRLLELLMEIRGA